MDPTLVEGRGKQDNDEVVLEVLPVIRIYRNGTIERLTSTDFVPPSLDPIDGVSTKDVTFVIKQEEGGCSLTRNLSARIFLPDLGNGPHRKLPLFLHFHGGAFCVGSPCSSFYHGFLVASAAIAPAVVLSVDYRKAPEHPIPAAYEDSWETLTWVAEHQHGKGPENWLNDHVDFERLFLGGESAGANIAHNVAIMAGSSELWSRLGLSILGLALIQPYFWGTEPIGLEKLDRKKPLTDMLWPLACPSSPSNDDPRVNPFTEGAPSLSGLGCKRVLICVAEKDILRFRGRMYCESLGRSGWRGTVEVYETKGKGHIFHLNYPECEEADHLVRRLADFLNGIPCNSTKCPFISSRI